MRAHFEKIIYAATGAKKIYEKEKIQTLWSGYGEILRYELEGCQLLSVVVKHVQMPGGASHPRGWNTDLSHQRKVKSYEVEYAWYERWASQCDDSCKVPQCLAIDTYEEEVFFVMEDLDASGFPQRKRSVTNKDIKACLTWLANFHATFLERKPEGLWEIGTYWHLDTRPEELQVLDDLPLKNAAKYIDQKLNACRYKTFVHGDAKLANFCFSKEPGKVAAVDFQYVGEGCGMKDVAYFIGSCLYEDECEKMEQQLLDTYFSALRAALSKRNSKVDIDALIAEWTEMYPYAWTDFHRFIKGWSPGHWKINSYSEKMARRVLQQIQQSQQQ